MAESTLEKMALGKRPAAQACETDLGTFGQAVGTAEQSLEGPGTWVGHSLVPVESSVDRGGPNRGPLKHV